MLSVPRKGNQCKKFQKGRKKGEKESGRNEIVNRMALVCEYILEEGSFNFQTTRKHTLLNLISLV